jgi:hypothetical protein
MKKIGNLRVVGTTGTRVAETCRRSGDEKAKQTYEDESATNSFIHQSNYI